MKWLLVVAMLLAGCAGAPPTPAPTLISTPVPGATVAMSDASAYPALQALLVCPDTGSKPDWCQPGFLAKLLSTARVEPALPAPVLLILLAALGFAGGLTYLRVAHGAGYLVFAGGFVALLWIEGSLSSVHFKLLDVLHVASGSEGIATIGFERFMSATGEVYGGTLFVLLIGVALLLGMWASTAFNGSGEVRRGK
jgi:hypothetical protein